LLSSPSSISLHTASYSFLSSRSFSIVHFIWFNFSKSNRKRQHPGFHTLLVLWMFIPLCCRDRLYSSCWQDEEGQDPGWLICIERWFGPSPYPRQQQQQEGKTRFIEGRESKRGAIYHEKYTYRLVVEDSLFSTCLSLFSLFDVHLTGSGSL
jgi:hypothetical protein